MFKTVEIRRGSARAVLAGRASVMALAAATASVLATPAALAQSASVVVTAPKDTAAYEAPTVAPLDAAQPTSVISQHFIENNVPATGGYDDVIFLSPSVNSVAPNGPGLMENQSLTIRGFQDGQYNMTIDGIAWGDSNDFTHHTTSYLMGHDLGQVSVDRGPGTAETLGDATFGGTISQQTKDPLDRQTAELYGSAGSFNTYLGGAELDTGSISGLNGAKGLLDVEDLRSDGALSDMGQERYNIFSKVVAPVDDKTTITAAVMYNALHQNVGLGAEAVSLTPGTPSYASNGYSYGLNGNPASQAYYGYNYDEITTDLAYVAAKTELFGVAVDSKFYSYAYNHLGHNGLDPNGDTPNGTSEAANDVPGQVLHNDYVSYGNITRLSKDLGIVDVNGGFWFDDQTNNRALYGSDFTLNPNGSVLDMNQGANGVLRQQRNILITFQPYVQLDIKPLPGLVISPGVKYDYFERNIAAPVNQGTEQPLYYDHVWALPVPSIDVRYSINQNLSVYGQIAEGFLAPNLNVLYTTNPALSSSMKPETTWNYQTGASYQAGRLSLSGDLYYIDFQNEIVPVPGVGSVTTFQNIGGAIYYGAEAEATVGLVDGFSLYGNGSLNTAYTKATALSPSYNVPNSPTSTGAIGLIYDQHSLYGSLLAKYVGPRYGDTNDFFPLKAYTTAQLSVGYTFQRTPEHPQFKVSAVVDNLFDTRGVQALAGYTGSNGNPLVWNIVPTNFQVKLSAAF